MRTRARREDHPDPRAQRRFLSMPGKMVEFAANGTKTSAYLATPASGKGPGVLVIQEWWGLVRHIKNVCDRFATEGFTALAPDMYHGKTASEPDGATKLFMALNIAQAEKDLRGAAQYLAGQSSTKKLGAVGFCMGGQLALFAADRKSTRLNSSHSQISYAVFCLKKKKKKENYVNNIR